MEHLELFCQKQGSKFIAMRADEYVEEKEKRKVKLSGQEIEEHFEKVWFETMDLIQSILPSADYIRTFIQEQVKHENMQLEKDRVQHLQETAVQWVSRLN